MRVLGIDPGSQRSGFAVLEISEKNLQPRIVDIGVWNLMGRGPRPSIGERLESLHVQSQALLRAHNPRWVGIEKVVHFRNAASAHVLAEARGVLRLALHESLDEAEKRLIELSPTAVKKTASGFGMATKKGVLRAVMLRFPELAEIQKKEDFDFDAFDALAIALSTWIQVKRPGGKR